MSERETPDFMSVDSFSQLPFIRPSPKPSNSPSSSPNPAIRLFGIEFPPDTPSPKESAAATETKTAAAVNNSNNGSTATETGRKFECHYCCRNFPTSQALGGHQNAHKRERQHAKRAHLQSAMAAAHAAAHHPIAEGHVYGFLNYHRLAGATPATVQQKHHHPSTARFGLDPPPGSLPAYHPSWSSSGHGGDRLYAGGLGSVSQPINGSPLPGLWRVPNSTTMGVMVQRDSRSMALPLFGGALDAKPAAVTTVGGVGSSSSSSALLAEPGAVKDHTTVSLDLHL